ncbi:methionine ABC transporter ATP-binding protein [Massilibacterium senegalense]|uniref:methionine ABC transporter ATP-binding protein n=1 Tax=Massilibacterium senegalense TaxID=1632858 RepID=UPI000782EB18|nr:methionine ABC transporter ATP-binding protein [Massilibacterium senegalense]
MIKLEGIKKIFATKTNTIHAVDDINLEISKGEIFGIIGYSGAGKSTLIRMLNMLEKPTSGSVVVAGKNMAKLSGGELRKARQEIGMIFQHFNLLWSRTVKENIEFPLEIAGVKAEEREKRALELIELVGLKGREHAYPSQLSGGQKQRVGIARALANQPKVLLCDEATSALDPKTTDDILDLLVDINKRFGITIVLITHEMHVIRKICHRVAVMQAGKIVEVGNVLDVFQHPEQAITKDFVNQEVQSDEQKMTIDELQIKYPNQYIYKLLFLGNAVEQPIMNDLIRQFDISVNILQGEIARTQTGAYGSLYVQMDGQKEIVQQAVQFLQNHQVEVEVVNNVN